MIQKILVPLDGSALAESALPQAVAVAKALAAEIVVLRIQETDGRRHGELVDSVVWRMGRAEDTAYVKGIAARLCGQGVRAAAVLAEGDPAEEILKQVRQQAVDLVVLSSHGRSGPQTFSLGSTTQKVLSQAGTSVLVVREEPPGEAPAEVRFLRVMVPLDGSQQAQWALLQAVPLVRAGGGELLLVHVVTCPALARRTPPAQEEAELARQLVEHDRRLAERYLGEMQELLAGSGVRTRSLLFESPHVVQTLDKAAADEQVSLMVISAHGCSGAAPWPYGSVADRLIHHGTTPLLVLQDLTARLPPETTDVQGRAPALTAV
ncbi:MAG: universal stress protein [Thermoanaerobaculia bacterium]